MTPTHNILVCTEDAVLAKKVRILLARDECEVEILSNPRRLERRLSTDAVSLLVVSGKLASEDAVAMLTRLGAKIPSMPPTLILGTDAKVTPDFATAIADAGDTSAIYRLASEALARSAHDATVPNLPQVDKSLADAAGTTQRTPLATLAAARAAISEASEDAFDFGSLEFPSPEQIENQLSDAPFEDATFQLSPPTPSAVPEAAPEPEQEDITVFDVASFHATAHKSDEALAGPLDPPRFARALFQCWTSEAQGALTVATPDETLTVYFEGGVPVHVESNLHGDLFGRNLVQKGRLSDAQYGDAAKQSVERGLAIGHAVVELGFLSRDAYGRELGEDAHDRIVRRLGMRGGSYELVPHKRPPITDRPYRLSVGRILVEGLKRFCDDAALSQITGDVESRYFRVRSSIDDLSKRFPITDKEKALLTYSGRAYNVLDASELSGLDARGARVLMALLLTAGEIEDFTPGVAEFEARIREERQRQGLSSLRPSGESIPPPAAAAARARPRRARARAPALLAGPAAVRAPCSLVLVLGRRDALEHPSAGRFTLLGAPAAAPAAGGRAAVPDVPRGRSGASAAAAPRACRGVRLGARWGLDPADARAAHRPGRPVAAPGGVLTALAPDAGRSGAGDARAHALPPALPARRHAARSGQLRRRRRGLPRRHRSVLRRARLPDRAGARLVLQPHVHSAR
jgi:hypothetical protein